ncbi:MAG TPA: SAM-dependent methyltransferase [Geobacteraceae bacterium]
MEDTTNSPLQVLLLERIRARGPIPFAEYMAACLYEPGLGYYTSPGRKVGAEGDFYTSSNVHQVFGRLIARELCRMWETMGEPPAWSIVEAGAGNGRLARDVLDAVASINPTLYDRLTYRLVEAEPSLVEVQRQMLAGHEARLAWGTSAELAAGKLSFTGCLLSNELIDAFPVHIVEMTPEGLREVFVAATAEGFAEQLAPLSTPELETYLRRYGAPLCVGQRAEINLGVLSWLDGVARSLERGFILTIDYGYTAAELYAPLRLNGTLLCYWRHTVEENPFLRPGEQDMTAHVNFSALMERGKEAGLDTVWYGEQYRFLLGAGMMAELLAGEGAAATEQERLKNRLALKKLILPDGGMGDTFKVLVQAKGVAAPRLLCMGEWRNGV